MSGPVHDSTRFSFFDRNLNWSTFNAAGVAVARVPDDLIPSEKEIELLISKLDFYPLFQSFSHTNGELRTTNSETR
jgi:hypothetical protein